MVLTFANLILDELVKPLGEADLNRITRLVFSLKQSVYSSLLDETVSGFQESGIKELLFLIEYYKILKDYKEKNLKEVGQRIIKIMSKHIAPRKYWIILLRESVALLKDEMLLGQIFGVKDTYILMNCFEEIKTSHKSDFVQNEEEMKKISYYLGKNLSESIINGNEL